MRSLMTFRRRHSRWRLVAQTGVALAMTLLGARATLAAEPAAHITIDSEAARRTVEAISNANLTRAQALLVADLTANKALVAEAIDFGVPASRGSPLSETSVYSIGFLEAGQLYYDVGYVMAKAIATRDGDAAIGRLIAMPGDAFVHRYIELSEESGSKLPKLQERAKK